MTILASIRLRKQYASRNAACLHRGVPQHSDERLLQCRITLSNLCMKLAHSTYAVWFGGHAEPLACNLIEDYVNGLKRIASNSNDTVATVSRLTLAPEGPSRFDGSRRPPPQE